MAQRRMFSQKIVGSDAFIEMPVSARELYFQLGMYADDDGFINPKKIIRMLGASDDDLKILVGKRFVLRFENGVVVIKHWKINNLIRKDFYEETIYSEEKNLIGTKKNKSYTDDKNQMLTICQQFDDTDKIRLDKVREDKIRLDEPSSFKKEEKVGTKAFYRLTGEEMRKTKDGKWWVIPKEGGDWLEFVGSFKSDVIFK